MEILEGDISASQSDLQITNYITAEPLFLLLSHSSLVDDLLSSTLACQGNMDTLLSLNKEISNSPLLSRQLQLNPAAVMLVLSIICVHPTLREAIRKNSPAWEKRDSVTS